MASSSAAAQPPSHLPCIRALHLNAASAAAVLDVAAAVKHDQETSGQQAILALRALGEAKTWSEVALSAPSWAKVSALRTQLISESDSVRHTRPSLPPFSTALDELTNSPPSSSQS